MTDIARLRTFVQGMTRAVEKYGQNEAAMLPEGRKLLARLIARDDWLPQEFALAQPDTYRQYLSAKAQCLCARNQRGQTIRFRLFQQHPSKYLGPVCGTGRGCGGIWLMPDP